MMKLLQLLPHLLLHMPQQRQALHSVRRQAGALLLLLSRLCPMQLRLLAPTGSAGQLERSLLLMQQQQQHRTSLQSQLQLLLLQMRWQ
jgi:hypothetical protein